MRRIAIVLGFWMPALAMAADISKGEFELIGIGGGGAIFTPIVYPGDSKILFVTCDMTGVYRSADAGKTWQFLHFKQLNNALNTRPAFSDKAMFWASGNVLKVSKDKGLTWAPVIEGEQPWKGETITHLAAGSLGMAGEDSSKDGAVILVGTASGVWLVGADAPRFAATKDTIKKVLDGKCAGLCSTGKQLFAVLQSSDGKTNKGLHASSDGVRWTELKVEPAGDNPITSIAGVPTTMTEKVSAEVPHLYVTVENVGVLRSIDGGRSWANVMKWDKQGDILMPPKQTSVVYVCQAPRGRTIWRTADAGKTWQSIFDMDLTRKGGNVELSWLQTYLKWDYMITHFGMGIDPNDPSTAMITTQGEFYVTRNAGKSWQPHINQPVERGAGILPAMTQPDRGQDARATAFKSIGLEVTVSCGYAIDPNEPTRHYIQYEDIGLARSVDGGHSWIPATKGCPWGNTFYQLAFDPFVKGRIYAACSSRHDIPAWLHVGPNTPAQKGGVCVSDDFAANWQVLSKSLPELPCTSLVIDPTSTKDKLTMYAGFYEGGVYKSTDGGKTWEKKSAGLGNAGNLHVFRVIVHPASGNLYCVITAMREGREFKVPGGVWKSTDGGETWKDLTADLKLAWPSGFAVHPKNENVLYLVGGTTPDHAGQGGLYKTIDGGKTWEKIVSDADLAKYTPPGYSNYGCVKLHPDDPNLVYFGTESHSLWLSRDAGAKWEVFEKMPFRGIVSIDFDEADPKTMYIGTYGVSVLKGNYLPVK